MKILVWSNIAPAFWPLFSSKEEEEQWKKDNNVKLIEMDINPKEGSDKMKLMKDDDEDDECSEEDEDDDEVKKDEKNDKSEKIKS